MQEPEALRRSVLTWVRSMACPESGPGRYRFARHASPDVRLLASYFAALTMDLAGGLDQLTIREKQQWSADLKSFQDPAAGYFHDPALRGKDLRNAHHTLEHFHWHDTPFACAAIYALGDRPDHPLTYIHPFRNPDTVIRYLEDGDYARSGAWMLSNWFMDLACALLLDERITSDPANRIAVDAWFDWHDRNVDPKTGLWGTDRGCRLHNAMCGAYHQYLIYAYCGRPLPCPRQAIDSILSLQNDAGLFGVEGGGGACEDLDALHSLILLSRQTDHRRFDVRTALTRAAPGLMGYQNPDGGFCYNRHRHITQAGWTLTEVPPGESTQMATNFRMFTLATLQATLASAAENSPPYRFHRSPAHGFHPEP